MSSFIADHNEDYKSQEYWDARFEKEEEYEWLVKYADVAHLLQPLIRFSQRILVIGCGNSRFSSDLYDAGYTNIVNIDYSPTVIERMKTSNSTRIGMTWIAMDMTVLDFPIHSFDVVLDKAAMDAIMVDEGSVWDPESAVIDMAHKMCCQIGKVLVPTGIYIQISFSQPHFRTKYLMGNWISGSLENPYEAVVGHSSVYGWTLGFSTITSLNGTFDNFCYVMTKD